MYCKSTNFGGYKLGVSQKKVIWRLLNLASPRPCNVRDRRHLPILAATNIIQNIIARQNLLIYSILHWVV